MKIGIIGTRGIPNNYGGFEQFAEFVAPALAERGHDVYVYNSSLHPYRESSWKGVKLIRKFDPEKKTGPFGQFIYDLNCIIDSRKRNYDVILQLGYTSSSVWTFLFPKRSILITNMDGLEWKRSKYSNPVKKFLKKAEKWAAIYSDYLIADSKGIQQHLLDAYQKEANFIAYGASLFTSSDESALSAFKLAKHNYNLLIARMEPENNIETILIGHQASRSKRKLVLVGNYKSPFGSYLKDKYENENTLFLGALYDLNLLNNLRHFSHFYFHGHSVGGTNPSLLEAMASQALIIAHENIFNKSVLGDDAFYFSGSSDITGLLNAEIQRNDFHSFLSNNNKKIKLHYSWHHITDLLENMLLEATNKR